MNSSDFIELARFSVEEAKEKLCCESLEETENVLNHLILSGVVHISEEVDSKKKKFYFTFVGVVAVKNHIIKCYPKYFKHLGKCSDLRLILRAIERYKSEHTNLVSKSDNILAQMPNSFSRALELLRDYYTYGLYSQQLLELTLNGQGDIDWQSTINTSTPVIRLNRPYYFDDYTNDSCKDDENYITRLHFCILSECSKLLKECELDKILGIKTPSSSQGMRSDFGTNNFICRRLKRELNIQYESQKQKTLRNLISWIENDSNAVSSSNIRLFGTKNFQVLWEKMCAEVFKSQYKQRLSTLDLGSIDLTNDEYDMTFEKMIKKPQWKANVGPMHEAEKTLNPDFVCIVKGSGNTHCHFIILDAKYYNIILDEKRVANQPGVEDVCKQFLYHCAYEDFISKHNMETVNIFASPMNEDEALPNGNGEKKGSYLAGTVRMPISFIANLPAIQIIMLAAGKVLNSYVNHTHLLLEQEVPGLLKN